MARTSTVTQQDIINDVHRIAKNHEGNVRVKHYIAEGAFSLGTVKNLFGSSKNDMFNQILTMNPTNDTPDKSTVRMLVKKFAKQMGKDGIELSRANFDAYASVSSELVANTFGSFTKGLADSGFVLGEIVETTPRKKRNDAKTTNENTEPTLLENTDQATPVEVDEENVLDDFDDVDYAEEWNDDWGEFPAEEDMEFTTGYDWGDDYDENALIDMNDDILNALNNAFA